MTPYDYDYECVDGTCPECGGCITWDKEPKWVDGQRTCYTNRCEECGAVGEYIDEPFEGEMPMLLPPYDEMWSNDG